MDKAITIDVIEQYLDGFRTGDFFAAKVSENMKFISPLKVDPVAGNTVIRGFLKDVSSRVEAVSIHQHIVDYPVASSIF